MFNSSSSYRFAPRFDDDDGVNLDCNPKVVKITSSQPISIDAACDGLLNFINNEKEKDYSSSQRRRLDRLFHIINGIPITHNNADENNRVNSNQSTQNSHNIKTIQQNRNNNTSTTSSINRHDDTTTIATTTTTNDEEMQAELVESVQDLKNIVEEKKKAKKEKKEAKKAKKAAKKEKKEAKKAKKTKKESK